MQPSEGQWEYIDTNQENDEISWYFDEVANDFDGAETRKIINVFTNNFLEKENAKNNIEDYQSTISYIKEKKIEPYCDDTHKIMLCWDMIYYHREWNDTTWRNINPILQWTELYTQIWYLEKINGIKYPTIFIDDTYSIKSTGIQKDGKTTYCSRTAQKDAKDIFWLTLPAWHAIDSFKNPVIDRDRYVDDLKWKTSEKTHKKHHIKYTHLEEGVDLNKVQRNDVNFADLLVKWSESYNWVKYCHRVVAFREKISKKRYILDPYNWWETPQLLEDYCKKDQIMEAKLYFAPKEVRTSQDISIPNLDFIPYKTPTDEILSYTPKNYLNN